MNKKLLIIALISISILATGCGDKKITNVNTQEVKTTVASKDQTRTDSTVKPTTKTTPNNSTTVTKALNSNNTTKSNNLQNSSTIPYQLVKNIYTNKKVTVNYPQITNLSDNSKQKLINSILKNEALKVLNYYKDSTGEVTLNINYSIKYKGNDRLSVQYSGTGYVIGAAHPNNLFYTTNLNINKVAKLRLSDLVKIDENLVNKFMSSVDKCNQPAKSSMQQYTTADLIKMFKNADSLDNIGTVNQSDTFSYFTDDTLGISVSVSHAEGDHAEFEIKK